MAFSGEVNDSECGPDAFTETSKTLNPNLNGRDIRDAFKGDEYQILLVANKFQTGFDQPLLCGMYVDRRLAGIQAVQTLSRLNRAHPGKDTTYVLDFVNSSEEILAAFKTYYETAELEGVTDPNLVYDLRAKLDAAGHYDDFEVDRVVAVEMNPKAKQGDLIAALEPVADRLLKRFKQAQEKLRTAQAKKDDEGRRRGQGRDQCAGAVQGRHGRVPAHVQLPVADIRLRQHGDREAVHVLQAAHAAAGVRSRARRHRPVQGDADAPQPEGSGQAAACRSEMVRRPSCRR